MRVCRLRKSSIRENHNAIEAVGTKPFIALKANTTGAVGGAFSKA
jgi:hypothetical protein